jgi:hypothetical protein
MENFKRLGKSSWAKHLVKNKKSRVTEQMASKSTQVKTKISLHKENLVKEEQKELMAIQNKFDSSEWTFDD